MLDGPTMITANAILVWIVQGACFGIGFLFVAWPVKRWLW